MLEKFLLNKSKGILTFTLGGMIMGSVFLSSAWAMDEDGSISDYVTTYATRSGRPVKDVFEFMQPLDEQDIVEVSTTNTKVPTVRITRSGRPVEDVFEYMQPLDEQDIVEVPVNSPEHKKYLSDKQ